MSRLVRLRAAIAAIVSAGIASALLAATPAPVPTGVGSATATPVFRDPSQSREARVKDLIAHLTLAEKANMMGAFSPGVARLKIPQYVWWNESLHGVARAGRATVFPQAIALAAMWDEDYLHTVADAIGREGRSKYNNAIAHNNRDRYYGLTFWSPNINIFRDPRWGRGQETYGEDPFLTSRMGVAYVRGLQGDDPEHLNVAAAAKHFAVHSGPEAMRREINVHPSLEDFHDTYLPAFEALVREAHVAGAMTAYNSLYGKPCSVSPVLYDLLYKAWDFKGYITSDCGAVGDLVDSYGVAKDEAEAIGLAVKAGLDLDCGDEAPALVEAVKRGTVSESVIDERLARLIDTQMRLGMFDLPGTGPYASAFADTGSTAHRAIALEAAHRALVLLKNDGTLPLDPAKLHRVAVIGPNADSVAALLGNYAGTPVAPVTLLSGLRAALEPAVTLEYVRGTAYIDSTPEAARDFKTMVPKDQGPEAALAAAGRADVILYLGGLSADLEGEADNNGYKDFDGRDRTRIELPPPQQKLLEALVATGKPVVYVNLSGSSIAFPWAADHVSAIVQAWYPGEQGGTAVADVLLGRYNPAGRLPVTFYRATKDLPAFDDYNMAHRTYRYFTGKTLYPFGHGLSYTTFKYQGFAARALPAGSGVAGWGSGEVGKTYPGPDLLEVTVSVTNSGSRDGDEVVQVYAREPEATHPRDTRSLCAFTRVHLKAVETKSLTLRASRAALRRWNNSVNDYRVPTGNWTISIGASSDDIRGSANVGL